MKKTLLVALGACMFLATANAQPFKQAGGENNLQLLFSPLGNNPISLNGGIAFRKFNATGTAAWRVGFSVGSVSNTDILHQAADTFPTAPFSNFPDTIDVDIFSSTYTLVTGLNQQAERKNSTFTFSIRPGYEKHFAGTDRLSPYVGAELILSISSFSSDVDTITRGNYTAIYRDTATSDVLVPAAWTKYTLNQKGGSTTFGVNLVAGFDFYLAKNLSLGAELNFGFSTTSHSDLETEYVKNTFTATSITDVNFVTTYTIASTNAVTSLPKQKQGSSSMWGPNVVGQLKLGWLF